VNRPHVHAPDCPAACNRQWDLDERSETGAYRIVTRSGYGKRGKKDRPWWWPVLFHTYKALIQILSAVGILWLASKLGLEATK
jgi:hypothetical protein